MSDSQSTIYDPENLDTYNYGSLNQIGIVQKFLWWCAGADPQLLARCPKSERIKEEGIGGVVLATAILAFLSGSFAMYIVFGPSITGVDHKFDSNAAMKSIFVGLIWSLIILNLDRFVVSSTGHGDGTESITLGEFIKSAPRIAMATVIGLCLSAPLEITVMASQIETRIQSDNEKLVKEYTDNEVNKAFQTWTETAVENRQKKEAELEELNNNIKELTKIINSQSVAIEDEVRGRSGSKIKGEGPAVKRMAQEQEKRKAMLAAYEAQKADLKKEIAPFIKAIDDADKRRDKMIEDKKVELSKDDGLIKRIIVAHEVGGKAYWILAALLMIIEIAPVFFKMMIPRGPYLNLVDNQNEIVNAKNGIIQEQLETESSIWGKTVILKQKYLQAESLSDVNKAQMQTELKLIHEILSKHEEKITGEIKEDYQKFMSPNEKSRSDK